MTRDQLLERVRAIVVEYAEVTAYPLSEDTDLMHDLGLDELDLESLLVAIEDELGVEPADPGEAPDGYTVGGLLDSLEERIAANQDALPRK